MTGMNDGSWSRVAVTNLGVENWMSPMVLCKCSLSCFLECLEEVVVIRLPVTPWHNLAQPRYSHKQFWDNKNNVIDKRIKLIHMGVSKNNGTPKSSILIGFSIINNPFWGTPIFGNIHINTHECLKTAQTWPSNKPHTVL